MQDAADEITLRDEEGALRADFLHAVEAALEAGDTKTVRDLTLDLHEADLADLIQLLRPDRREPLIAALGRDFNAAALSELDEGVRDQVLEEMPNEAVAEALQQLDSDEAVYLIEDLDKQDQTDILAKLPSFERAAIERSLEYPEDSAGRIMQTDFIAVPPFWSVGQTIDYMRDAEDLPDRFYEVFVVDPSFHLIGSVALDRLLRSKRPVNIEEITESEIHPIAVASDQEEVARTFERYNLTSAPVVDPDQRLLGVITADDVAALDLRGAFRGQTLTAGSSGWLASAFAAEGDDLDAMINYESILAADRDLTILYPSEGVVTADYPLVLLDRGEEAAYDRLVAALLDPAIQAEITDRTLRRPVVPGVARAAAIPAVDPNEVPFPATVAAVDALLFAYLDEDRAPPHTIYVLDTSGSMSGQPLDELKAALTQLTGVDGSLAGRFTRFRQRERVTMLPFSSEVGAPTTFEIDDVSTGSPVLADIRDYAAGLAAGGETDLYGALDAAYRLAADARAADPDRFYTVVLLSDGASTTGPDLEALRAGALAAPGADGVRTFPILFGQSDGPAMEEVADATGGLVFDSAGDLTSVFNTIRGWQ